jgi:hypothetical protein
MPPRKKVRRSNVMVAMEKMRRFHQDNNGVLGSIGRDTMINRHHYPERLEQS